MSMFRPLCCKVEEIAYDPLDTDSLTDLQTRRLGTITKSDDMANTWKGWSTSTRARSSFVNDSVDPD